jgi:hypothetical protein
MGSFRNVLKKYWARKAQIYMKGFWHSVESILLCSFSPGVGMGHNRVKHFYVSFKWEKFLKNFLFKKLLSQKKNQIYLQAS